MSLLNISWKGGRVFPAFLDLCDVGGYFCRFYVLKSMQYSYYVIARTASVALQDAAIHVFLYSQSMRAEKVFEYIAASRHALPSYAYGFAVASGRGKTARPPNHSHPNNKNKENVNDYYLAFRRQPSRVL